MCFCVLPFIKCGTDNQYAIQIFSVVFSWGPNCRNDTSMERSICPGEKCGLLALLIHSTLGVYFVHFNNFPPSYGDLFLTTVGVCRIRSGADASIHALSSSCLSFLVLLFLVYNPKICIFKAFSPFYM